MQVVVYPVLLHGALHHGFTKCLVPAYLPHPLPTWLPLRPPGCLLHPLPLYLPVGLTFACLTHAPLPALLPHPPPASPPISLPARCLTPCFTPCLTPCPLACLRASPPTPHLAAAARGTPPSCVRGCYLAWTRMCHPISSCLDEVG